MKWSYAEMAVAIEGLGLEWALNDLDDCLRQLIQMSGPPAGRTLPTGKLMDMGQGETLTAPSQRGSSSVLHRTPNLPSASVDAIIFDPPYHNNVNYAELSDFFYVWLKRTAGYVLKRLPDGSPPH